MKYFGFINEHENKNYAKSIKDLINEDNKENLHREEVLKYLKRGVMCVPFMGCVENAFDPNFNTDEYDDDEFIAYSAIDTDGEWFWPQYIVNYIEKYPSIKIDPNFLKYILKNKDREIKLSEAEIYQLENEYLKKAGFKKER